MLKGEKLKVFTLRSGKRQRCLLSPFLFITVLEVLPIAIRQEKEMRGVQIDGVEVKLSLLADDLILYKENAKNSTKKLLELVNKFSKISGYKINV